MTESKTAILSVDYGLEFLKLDRLCVSIKRTSSKTLKIEGCEENLYNK